MKILSLDQALSLAAIAKAERERRQWLRTYGPHVGAEQVGLSQCYFDEIASKALAQSLADAVCSEYPEIV